MKENNIFDPSGCLTDKGLVLYAKNALSKKEKALVEKHISTCELCADALEGFKLTTPVAFDAAVHDIHSRIDKLVESKAKRINYTRWLAAASIILLLGIGTYWMFSIKNVQQEQILSDKLTKEETPKISPPENKESQPPQAPAEIINNKKEVVKNQITSTSKSAAAGNGREAMPPVIHETNSATVGSAASTEAMADANNMNPAAPSSPTQMSPLTHEDISAAPARAIISIPQSQKQQSFDVSDMLAYVESVVNRENNAEGVTKLTDGEKIDEDRSANFKEKKSSMKMAAMAAKAEHSPSFSEAVNLYHQKEYEKANDTFEKILNTNPDNDKARTYAVLAKINSNKINEAYAEIAAITRKDPHTGKYLEAISLLKEGKKENAELILQELASTKNVYQTIAVKTLEKLR